MPSSPKPSIGTSPGRQDDVVILVMGATGSGKSSVVSLTAKTTKVRIGRTLESETANIDVIRFVDNITGRKVTIVDTPGFDDSRRGITDTDILKQIATFLLNEYNANKKLHGLVYVHRISDPRFSKQQGQNLTIFRNLCGTNAYKNVVVLTTFWDEVTTEVGEKREAQMKVQFFKDFVQGGARFMRHDRTQRSARALLSPLCSIDPVITQLQTEMGNEGKSLVDTAAGAAQQDEINRIVSKNKEEISDLKAELEKVKESNYVARRELEEDRTRLLQELARWQREKAQLQEGLDKGRSARQQLETEIATEKERRQQEERQFNATRAGTVQNVDYEEYKALPYSGRPDKYIFAQSDQYPPYLKSIPRKERMSVFEIFNFTALTDTAATLLFRKSTSLNTRTRVPTSKDRISMEQIVSRNRELHITSRESVRNNPRGFKPDMHFHKNIGLRDDWYTDAAFGQQQFTGTNATTIILAPRHWIEEFKMASNTQQRADVTTLLTDDPASIYMQDYSSFRSAMDVSPSTEFTSDGRYGCASVVLFRLEPAGKLHPLAITLDHRGSIERSVTIFNHSITSATTRDEATDWPWRYAKMCAQCSDWLLHEVAIHLVNTHLVEEVIIVSVNRAFDPSHIVFKLLEPHWSTTLPLNAAARETLVPKIIIGLTGFTPKQVYAFVKHSYSNFDWTALYIPNDLRRRGFPIEDLEKPKYHNYGYARNIARMWGIIRNFVHTVLQSAYPGGDAQVDDDRSIYAFYQDVRSHWGGQLSSFPDITTLDALIDFVTMCIHIASPQHTAVNYLQQYYLTFVPNKPSALFSRLPQSLTEIQGFGENDVLSALPIRRPREWWIMAHVPYMLSFETPQDSTILHYARTASDSRSTPQPIREASKILMGDLEAFSSDVYRYSSELDDQQTPYEVLDPGKTAISILI